MKQGKTNEDMPKLEAGMVFKVKTLPDWFLVLDHDKRLYAHIKLVQNNVKGIIEIVKVIEAGNDCDFDPDQVTRIVYETVGDTRAVDILALKQLLGHDVLGDQQAEWIKASPKKKMTVAEVEEALGYGVEIVSD